MSLVQKYLAPSDYSPEETWRLVEWCRGLGADEFTIDCLGTDAGTVAPRWRTFGTLVNPFTREKKIRERMSGRTTSDLTRLTELWELNDTTLGALKQALTGGLLGYDPRDEGSFEDPVIYRDGQLLLGVLSHEAFAVLRLSDSESLRFSEAGFPGHDSLPRVG
ncbi:MAG: hypothetical protein ACJ77T_14435 [Gemmatimonadaceae bacterium]